MQPTIRPLRNTSAPPPPSWSSLVATTLGLDDFGRVTALVSAQVPDLDGYRLIVQSYAASSMVGNVPGLYAHPLAAAQCAVDSEELKSGVSVVLVHSSHASSYKGCVVVAWVEPGHPDLEFDGLCARPTSAALLGTSRTAADHADVLLAPRATA